MIAFLLSLSFLLLYGLCAVYVERKTAAFIQDRIGPYEVGKWGMLQPLADILKLIQKEHIKPQHADKYLYHAAPFLAFIAVLLALALFPIFALKSIPIPMALVWIMAFLSLEIVAILLAGWASHSKFSLYGTTRAVAQLIAYEIPIACCLIAVVLVSGTLDLHTIALQQGPSVAQHPHEWTWIQLFKQWSGCFAWNICQAPVLIPAGVIFFISAIAQAKRIPFDLPEAESEIVGGYHTEYAGIQWAWFMIAEYAVLWILSMGFVWLFLGAGYSPFPNIGPFKLALWTNGHGIQSLWFTFWIMTKTIGIVWLQMWIRWSIPRFRMDQLLTLSWKYLTPASLIVVYLTSIWTLKVHALL